MSFNSSMYTVEESAGKMRIAVVRSGDLSGETSVVCTCEDGSALSPSEYQRVSTKLTFFKGDRVKLCDIPIKDDSSFEDSKEFYAILKDPRARSKSVKASVGSNSKATVLITDDDR